MLMSVSKAVKGGVDHRFQLSGFGPHRRHEVGVRANQISESVSVSISWTRSRPEEGINQKLKGQTRVRSGLSRCRGFFRMQLTTAFVGIYLPRKAHSADFECQVAVCTSCKHRGSSRT